MPIDGYIDTIFGSAGSLATVPDAVQSDGSVSYSEGYGINYTLNPVTNPSALNVENTKMNQIFNDITTAIQLQQQGLPAPFITSAMNNGSPFSYAQYATVIYGGVAYQSNVSGNTDTPPSTKWNVITLSAPNQFVGGTSTGSANAQTVASVTPASGLSLSVNGQSLVFTAGYTNTGSTTLAVTAPSIAATVIKKVSGASLVNLSGGEIVASAPVYLTVDTAASCWVLNSGPALGTMAPLNIGNNMANDTSGNAVATIPPSAISGTSHTYALAGWGALVARSNSGTAMTDTIPGTSGALPAGWYTEIQNTDATASDTIGVGSGGSFMMGNQTPTTITILPGETWQVQSQGSGNYEWIRTAAATLHSGAPQSSHKKLTAGWLTDTTANVMADAVIVQDSSGNTRRLTSVNQTFNTAATVGTNTGLDTGSLADNTWYYGYVTFDPTTNSPGCCFSLSATGPALVSGYTMASGYVTAFFIDGSGNMIGYIQDDDDWQYVLGSNLTALPAISSGTVGNYGTSWGSATVRGAGSLMPPAATLIKAAAFSTAGSNNKIVLAPNSGYANPGVSTAAPPPYGADTSNGSQGPAYFEFLLESNAVSIQALSSTGSCITGFKLNI